MKKEESTGKHMRRAATCVLLAAGMLLMMGCQSEKTYISQGMQQIEELNYQEAH